MEYRLVGYLFTLNPDVGTSLLAADHAEPATSHGNIFWVGAVVFGLAFLAALVWSIRPTGEKQIEKARKSGPDRDAVVEEIARLDRDFRMKKIPPAAYRDERNRFLRYAAARDVE